MKHVTASNTLLFKLAIASLLSFYSNFNYAEDAKPNVLLWMMDDVGFAQLSSYGGLVDTPNIDRVANMGLRYTNYHTAPICSASRASILTGRMPHTVHIGGHATAAMDYPGYDAHIPRNAGTIAENLHQAGYHTTALGKWDHLPNTDASPAGPFTYWPQGQGFDGFYGFLAADVDNFNPVLIEDTKSTAKPDIANYHLSEDLADRAITMFAMRHSNNPARPFFLYWATGAAHAPHHAPQVWLDRYKGKFDMGWDKAREQILKNQKALGIIPQQTQLASRPNGMPAWDSLSNDAQKLYARQMEAFAAALSHADAQFGRMLDVLEQQGELDNTMVIIVSDNGASAEGGPDGLFNEANVINAGSSFAANMTFLDRWGGPETYPHYAYGWAVAGNTPLRYFKQTTHEGGTRVPLVIAWPKGIKSQNQLRHQFVHVTDIAATILDSANVAPAKLVNNQVQMPFEGESFAPQFDTDKDPRSHRSQYVELYGNKGLWHEGYAIVTDHRYKTWDWQVTPTFDEPWMLFDIVNDPGQTENLAKEMPEKVALMSDLFDEQVQRFNVLPHHNLRDTAAHSYKKSKLDFARRKGIWFYPNMVSGVNSAFAPPINNQGYNFRSDLELLDSHTTGAIFAFGGAMGGTGLFLENNVPVFVMTDLQGKQAITKAEYPLTVGAHHLKLSVLKGKPDEHGEVSFNLDLTANGKTVFATETKFALPRYFGLSETFGVGIDDGSSQLKSVRTGHPINANIKNTTFDFSSNENLAPTIH